MSVWWSRAPDVSCLHDLDVLLIVKRMLDGERRNELTCLLYVEDKKPIDVE